MGMNAVIDIIIVDIYLIAMVLIGFFSLSKVRSAKDYYVAGRSLKTIPVAATVGATILGGSALLGRSGMIYSQGIGGALLGLPYLAGMYVFSGMSARIQRIGSKNHFMSIPDLMEYRFGKKIRLLVAGLIAFSMMATVASQITAFATIITALFGRNISFMGAAWIALVVIIIYTAISGLFGVVYTDYVQLGLLLLFVYIILPIRSVSAGGGISQILANVPKELLTFQVAPDVIGFLFTNFIITFAGAEMWQRSFAAKNEKSARNGMLVGNSVYLLTILITIPLSLSAVVLIPTLITETAASDMVLPILLNRLLPAGLMGLTSVGLIAAVMSSADSYLLVSVQTVVRDIIRPLQGDTSMSEQTELRLARFVSVLVGIGALIISLYITGVYNVLMFAWTFYAASVGVPAVAALYWKKATSHGIGAGVIAGFVSCVACSIWSQITISPALAGSAVCLIFTVVVSTVTYPGAPAPMPND